jgi:hypothetical protein
VFTSQDLRFRFTFFADESGQITGMDWGNLFVLEKVPSYQKVGFQRALFGTFLLMFLSGAIVGLVNALGGAPENRAPRVFTARSASFRR